MDTEFVFVTGATGFLGHYVLACLLQRSIPCVVLLRAPMKNSRARLARLLDDLSCDLNRCERDGRLVLSEGALDAIPSLPVARISAILHIAAATNFRTNGKGDPHKSNVVGTQKLLEWADRKQVKTLHYVSSAYSCGRVNAPVPEQVHSADREFHNDYERSKGDAERLCADWAVSTNASLTIFRPSIIVGEHLTGRSTRFAGFYLSARSTEFLSRSFEKADRATRHAIPLRIKGRPQDAQNIVPVDYVAEMIAGAVAAPGTWGKVYHLVHPSPPSNGEIKEAFEQHFDVGGGRFVDPGVFPSKDLNEHEQHFYDISRSIEHYFVDTPTFHRSNTEQLEVRLGIYCPRFESADLRRLIEYAQKANWGRESPSRRSTPGCATYFEQFLPASMADSQVARRTAVTATVRFIIEDDAEREWVCRFEKGRLSAVHRGTNGFQEDFGYRSNKEVFCEAIAGNAHPQELFLSGRAEIFGDVERALKMAMILHEFNKECPCDEKMLERMEEQRCQV